VTAGIRLRAFRADEIDLVWAAKRAEGWPADRNARRRLQRRLERSGALEDGFLEFAIEADGRLVGDVQARQPRYALPPGVFELGIELYDPADRGRGYGGGAVRLITNLLFDEHGASRVQASTAVGNAAMRRVLERLGFAYEGVMRAFMPARTPPAPGQAEPRRDDYALYAVTREEWARRPRASAGSPPDAPASP
jgi:RimJ/RimL family protein N-acetyltransferase